MEKDCEKTMKYFNRLYKDEMRKPNNDENVSDTNKVQSLKVPWTRFHSALMKGEWPILFCLFKNAENKQVKQLMCNSILDYTVDWSTAYDSVVLGNRNYHDEFEKMAKMLDKKVLNGWDFNSTMASQYKFELSLTFAALSGHMRIVKLLIQNGTSLHCSDSKGCSIFHNLAVISKENPSFSIAVYHYLLSRIACPNEKYELVTKENFDGDTALDIAAKEHNLEFVLALFQTDDVYRFVTMDCGPIQHVLYDISKYEKQQLDIDIPEETKHSMHFLYSIALVQEGELEYFHRCRILEQEPFKTWISSKIELNSRSANIWFTNLVLVFATFLIQMALYYMDHEDHAVPFGLAIFLVVDVVIHLFIQVIGVYTRWNIFWKVHKIWWNKGLPVGYMSDYIFTEITFMSYLLILECLLLAGVECNDKEIFFTWININIAMNGCISMMLLTQRHYRVAHLLSLINRMMWDVILFLAIWGILYFTYVLVFYTLTFQHHCESNDTSISPDIQEQYMFADFGRTAYDTFLLGLYILPPEPLHFEVFNYNIAMMIMYCGFLMIISVIMVNAIVAKMTEKVYSLHQFKWTIKHLQIINLALLLDGVSSNLTMCFKFYKRLQHKVVHKYFMSSEDGSQVFIRVIEQIPSLKLIARPVKKN